MRNISGGIEPANNTDPSKVEVGKGGSRESDAEKRRGRGKIRKFEQQAKKAVLAEASKTAKGRWRKGTEEG